MAQPTASVPQMQAGAAQAAPSSAMGQTFTAWFAAPGLTSTALTLAVVLGSAAVSAILTLVAMTTMDTSDTFPTTFSMLPLLMGWSLGGQFVLTGSTSYETVVLTFGILPMGALTAAGIGVYWLARRRASVDGSAAPLVPMLARAGAEAFAVALLACLVTAPFSLSTKMMGLSNVSVSSSPLMTILLVTLVVFVALVIARSKGQLLERMPSPVVQVGRELGALGVAIGVVLGIFVIIAYIGVALSRGWGFASILLLPVFLPNLVLAALGLGSLGGMTSDTDRAMELATVMPSLDSQQRGDAYAWAWLGSWSILLFVAMIIVIAAAAVRVGVSRARTGQPQGQRIWQLPLVALVVGAIAFYGLLPLRLSGTDTPLRSSSTEAARELYYGIQPNVLTFITFGIVVALISGLAEFLPMWLYSAFPAALPLAAGKKASAAWLAGTSGSQPGTTSAQQWVYGTDPVTGGSIATDTATGAVFSMDADTGQWVETTPASQAPAPAADGAAPAAAAGALPEPAPMDAASRRKVTRVVIAGGVVVALVVAGVVALNLVNGMRSPDKAVESYLSLLSEGKATEATKMVDPGVPNDQRKLLTDEALGAAKSRIKVTKIDEPTISGDAATVRAQLSLDGKAFTYTFNATKSSGSFGLESWKVNNALVMLVHFSAKPLSSLKVGGTTLDLPDTEDSTTSKEEVKSQYVYPATYPLAAPDSMGKYLELQDTSFTVTTPADDGSRGISKSPDQDMRVKAKPTDELSKKALEKVKEQTKTCTTVPNNEDKPCPYETSESMASMSVDKDATKVEFSKDSESMSFDSDEINISGTPKPSTFEKNPTSRKAKFKFSGKVEWSKDSEEPTIKIESSGGVY